jgi:hypothetical protein
MSNKNGTHQAGQGMVEYVVVLVFGVMVLTIGPGGDVLLDLLAVINDNHQGYSYASSLSDLPQFDSLGDYVLDAQGENIDAVENKLKELYDMVPSSPSFEFPDAMPTSASDILEGASIF